MNHPLTYALAADKKTLDIFVLGDIGLGFFADEGVSAENIIKTLSANKGVAEINVEVNSGGGSAFDGIAIYNALKMHGARVTMNVLGMAASAASIIVMAGDVVNIATGSMMMIHNVRASSGGTAGELRKQAEMQERLDGQMASIYMDRTAQTHEATLALMEAETWFTAEEAVAAGLADNVVGVVDMAACADVSGYGYTNAPAALVASAPAPDRQLPLPITAPTVAQPENASMKILAQAAGLSDSATEAEIVAKFHARDAEHAAELKAVADQLGELTAAIGEKGDKALGVVAALKASHAALEANTAELAEIKAKAEVIRHADLIAKGKADGKITNDPDLLAHYATQSADQLEAFLKVAPRVTPVGEPPHKSPAPVVASGDVETIKHDGKTYVEMSGPEKVELLKSQPELAARMQAQFRAAVPGNSAA